MYRLFITTIIAFLLTLSLKAQTYDVLYRVGAQLPILYTNNDRTSPKEDTDANVTATINFVPQFNTYFQVDYARLGKSSRFGSRIDYTFISAQQNDDYEAYNHYHQFSLLGLWTCGFSRYHGTTLGLGPNVITGDGKGMNLRLFLGGFFKYKSIIFSADINFYIPNLTRNSNIPTDSYKYGHTAIGVGYIF